MKKIIIFMLLLCISFSSIVYAIDLNGDLTIEEGGKVYINNFKDENIRNNILNKYNREISILSNYYDVDLTVLPFAQSEYYYCAPATVKQTIHYINGSSDTQANYATKLKTTTSGTDMTLIPNVLNNLQNKHYYIYSSFSSLSTWISYAKSSLDVGVPAIIDINSKGVVGWPYNTIGHFLNVSGMYIDGNVLLSNSKPMQEDNNIDNIISLSSSNVIGKVTDPYQAGYGNRWYDLNLIYNVNRNHFRSAIIH